MEIIGKYPPRPRVITGLYSLDHAFVNEENELGFPVGHGNEFFGLTYIGKTTFVLSLSGILAKKQKEDISFADLEGFDREHLIRIMKTVGFDGKLYIPSGTTKVAAESNEEDLDKDNEFESTSKRKKKEEREYDELILDEMISNLIKDNCCIGIVDSIGAVSTIEEQEGNIGEAFMGRRGRVLAQFSRKTLNVFRRSKTPKTVILINHWYPKLGGRGYVTPGGEVKKYIGPVQVLLKKHETFPDNSYIIHGTVKKNRWGVPNKSFYVFMLSGKGIHLGLSAVYDCLIYKKAQRGRGATVPIKFEDQTFTIAKLVKEARAGNDEIFEQFRAALDNYQDGGDSSGEHEDTEDGDNSTQED